MARGGGGHRIRCFTRVISGGGGAQNRVFYSLCNGTGGHRIGCFTRCVMAQGGAQNRVFYSLCNGTGGGGGTE